MLTWTELETHVAGEILVRWTHNGKPPQEGGRALYMLPGVYRDFEERRWPASDGEAPRHTAERRAAMRAVLKRFTLGDGILIRRDLKELGSPIDKAPGVAMRGYWEFRSQGRREETRLFGFFARPGAFVATAFKGRGEFREGVQLDWDNQREQCLVEWRKLTGEKQPMRDPWPVVTRDDLAIYLEVTDD